MPASQAWPCPPYGHPLRSACCWQETHEPPVGPVQWRMQKRHEGSQHKLQGRQDLAAGRPKWRAILTTKLLQTKSESIEMNANSRPKLTHLTDARPVARYAFPALAFLATQNVKRGHRQGSFPQDHPWMMASSLYIYMQQLPTSQMQDLWQGMLFRHWPHCK